MVERVGADDFVPKYSERELAARIEHRISTLLRQRAAA
jgi:two-component system chemotaxis response regulator CheV